MSLTRFRPSFKPDARSLLNGKPGVVPEDPVVEEIMQNRGNIPTFLKTKFDEFSRFTFDQTKAIVERNWLLKNRFMTGILFEMSVFMVSSSVQHTAGYYFKAGFPEGHSETPFAMIDTRTQVQYEVKGEEPFSMEPHPKFGFMYSSYFIWFMQFVCCNMCGIPFIFINFGDPSWQFLYVFLVQELEDFNNMYQQVAYHYWSQGKMGDGQVFNNMIIQDTVKIMGTAYLLKMREITSMKKCYQLLLGTIKRYVLQPMINHMEILQGKIRDLIKEAHLAREIIEQRTETETAQGLTEYINENNAPRALDVDSDDRVNVEIPTQIMAPQSMAPQRQKTGGVTGFFGRLLGPSCGGASVYEPGAPPVNVMSRRNPTPPAIIQNPDALTGRQIVQDAQAHSAAKYQVTGAQDQRALFDASSAAKTFTSNASASAFSSIGSKPASPTQAGGVFSNSGSAQGSRAGTPSFGATSIVGAGGTFSAPGTRAQTPKPSAAASGAPKPFGSAQALAAGGGFTSFESLAAGAAAGGKPTTLPPLDHPPRAAAATDGMAVEP